MADVHIVEVHELRKRLFVVRGARSERQAEAMLTVFLESGEEQTVLGDGEVRVVEQKGSGDRINYKILRPRRKADDHLALG